MTREADKIWLREWRILFLVIGLAVIFWDISPREFYNFLHELMTLTAMFVLLTAVGYILAYSLKWILPKGGE